MGRLVCQDGPALVLPDSPGPNVSARHRRRPRERCGELEVEGGEVHEDLANVEFSSRPEKFCQDRCPGPALVLTHKHPSRPSSICVHPTPIACENGVGSSRKRWAGFVGEARMWQDWVAFLLFIMIVMAAVIAFFNYIDLGF